MGLSRAQLSSERFDHAVASVAIIGAFSTATPAHLAEVRERFPAAGQEEESPMAGQTSSSGAAWTGLLAMSAAPVRRELEHA
jgi:hypothetical protein